MLKNPITSDFFRFLKEQVLTVTDLTRSSKLTDILDMYASSKDVEKVFVVQNSRNKDAQAVLVNLDYFQELLLDKEAIEEAMDQVIYEIALERKDEVADIPLAEVIRVNNIDLQAIKDMVENEEEI